MAGQGITVSFHGPLFTHGPAPIIAAGLAWVGDVVAAGEASVKGQLYPGHGLVTGHYRRSVNGEVLRNGNGIIHDNRVVYGPWLEGVSSRNSRTRFKGYAMFRNVVRTLERTAGPMMERRIDEAVRKMNGA